MRYYDLGNGFHVCYSTVTHFECENYERHKAREGHYKRGNIVHSKINESHVIIDENTAEVTVVYRNTKLHKGAKAKCPHCEGNIKYLGWRVVVEDNRKRKVVANLYSTGTKYPYSKYCKTLKNRKATIDRLIKKYS